jgi:hypothetical protein
MELIFNGSGPAELKRDDGWFYRLQGVLGMDMRLDTGLYGWREPAVMEVTIRDVSDQTLDSIRVLRDSFPDYRIEITTDY